MLSAPQSREFLAVAVAAAILTTSQKITIIRGLRECDSLQSEIASERRFSSAIEMGKTMIAAAEVPCGTSSAVKIASEWQKEFDHFLSFWSLFGQILPGSLWCTWSVSNRMLLGSEKREKAATVYLQGAGQCPPDDRGRFAFPGPRILEFKV